MKIVWSQDEVSELQTLKLFQLSILQKYLLAVIASKETILKQLIAFKLGQSTAAGAGWGIQLIEI